jgi:hypothetical protein
MLAGEHLDHETTQTPDISFRAVRGLLHDLGSHPKDGALERWSVRAITATHEIYHAIEKSMKGALMTTC